MTTEKCPGGRADYWECERLVIKNFEPEWCEGEDYPHRLVWMPYCEKECLDEVWEGRK